MQERILPYKGYAWERDLIEYCGTFSFSNGTNGQYVSPGVTIIKQAAGHFTVLLTDKVPIWDSVLNGTASQQNLTALDEGFGSTLMCQAQVRTSSTLSATKTQIKSTSAYFYDVPQRQVGFDVYTYVGGVLTDLEFCFRVLLSGQPAKFVQGQGA